ncbi:MAG: beta-carotene 3-hydroxylase [Salibacteraceae bacterium]|jgi:beta-carotene 3-hydroxylase|tara:strand:+ start:288 stop:737 length:450 start_codon:yes stop_codon:yes gene_type:complete
MIWLLIPATFLFMEFMAWFMHKYVMHGFLWFFHKDHHQIEPGFFEKNDVFFLMFAIPSWLLIMFGMMAGNDYRLYIGLGILAYGITYFLIHDVLIHQRFKWFRNTKNWYVRAMRKGHYVHHRYKNREDGECFGLLLVPMHYFTEAFKKR